MTWIDYMDLLTIDEATAVLSASGIPLDTGKWGPEDFDRAEAALHAARVDRMTNSGIITV